MKKRHWLILAAAPLALLLLAGNQAAGAIGATGGEAALVTATPAVTWLLALLVGLGLGSLLVKK